MIVKIKKQQLKKTSEEQLEKDGDKFFNWFFIAANKKLSEQFIEKYLDKLKLRFVLEFQEVSEAFIEKHINELNDELWEIVFDCQSLSEEFKEKYKNKE